jgi:hypothetical protein
MSVLKTRPLHPTQKVELKFRLLLGDLRIGPPIPVSERFRLQEALFEYGKAFGDKLVGVKIMHLQCKKAAKELSAVNEREKREGHVGVSAIGGPMTYASVYFETFLYFIIGAFDVLASINYHFMYRGDRKTLTEYYFKDQMETFIKHPNINREYAKLLCENKQWIEDVQKNRDGLAHKASVFLGMEKDRVVVEKRRPHDDKDLPRKRQFRDLLQYLDTTLENLYRFLDDYIGVHRKRVPFSDMARMQLDLLDKGLIRSVTP